MRSIILVLMVLVPLCYPINALSSDAGTVGEMLKCCNNMGNMWKGDTGKIVSFLDNYDSGYCSASFYVIMRSASLVDGGEKILHICFPENLRETQLIAMFIKYAEDNPERWNDDFFSTTLNYFIKKYPCGKKVRLVPVN